MVAATAAGPTNGFTFALGTRFTTLGPTVTGGSYDIPSQVLTLTFSQSVYAPIGVAANAWTMTGDVLGSVSSDATGPLGASTTQNFHMTGVVVGSLGTVTGSGSGLFGFSGGVAVAPILGGVVVPMSS